MRNALVVLLLVLGTGVAFCGQGGPATSPPAAARSLPLDPLRFLVGSWQGEGGGQPAQGSGSASFKLDLDGRVLVRRNHSEYPATAGKPAITHDDLMIIYPEPGTKRLEAVYFDNEGHVIEYVVEVSRDGQRVVLSSEPEPSSPTFRLTYVSVDENTVDVTFEIAPPGSPGGFRPYVSGRIRRTSRD